MGEVMYVETHDEGKKAKCIDHQEKICDFLVLFRDGGYFSVLVSTELRTSFFSDDGISTTIYYKNIPTVTWFD